MRPATLADVPRLLELVEAAYRGRGGSTGWTTESHLVAGNRTSADDLGTAIAAPGTQVLVAETSPDGSVLLGTITATLPHEAAGSIDATAVTDTEVASHAEVTGGLGLFAVDPGHQSGGVGTALMQAGEAWLAEHGASRVQLTVLLNRPELTAWYERWGYRPTGEQVDFLGPADALLVPGLGMQVLVRDL